MITVSARSSALFLFLIASSALAHHSGAMFDDQKSTTLTGSVKAFQWTNPHCWIQLLVRDGKEGTSEWSVEMGSPTQLMHAGWKPRAVQAGDKITVTVHPMRDGSTAGLIVSATFADGRPIVSTREDK